MSAFTAHSGATRWVASPTWRGVIYDVRDRGNGWKSTEVVDRCTHRHRSADAALSCSAKSLEQWRTACSRLKRVRA